MPCSSYNSILSSLTGFLVLILMAVMPRLGELLHWGPWKMCSDSLRIWASLSIGAPIVPGGTCALRGEARIPGILKEG